MLWLAYLNSNTSLPPGALLFGVHAPRVDCILGRGRLQRPLDRFFRAVATEARRRVQLEFSGALGVDMYGTPKLQLKQAKLNAGRDL